MTLGVNDVFGDGGSTRVGSNYESRPQQIQMANTVAEAIAMRQHLVVEAGMDRKSLLILSRQSRRRQQNRRRRKSIILHTISLQEQLIGKIPLLTLMPVEFRSAGQRTFEPSASAAKDRRSIDWCFRASKAPLQTSSGESFDND